MSDHHPKRPSDGGGPTAALSRRSFLWTGAASTAALGWRSAAAQDGPRELVVETDPDARAIAADDDLAITLAVNGTARKVPIEPRTTLVEALRDVLGLTGTKIGCNHGQCGACTVLLDGKRVNSCLVLAMSAAGGEVTTVEGLADPVGELHPMQTAFAENDAFQCGYCTPGQILSAIGCVEEGHAGSAAEIREYMSGNLCRCAAYPNIVAAVEAARDATGA